MSTFAGVDWGGAHHQVAVVDDDGRELWNRKFAHDRDGLDDLIDSLAGVAGLVGVAIERSEGIVVERLQHHRVAVFPVSPRSRPGPESAIRPRRKNDRFDAFVSPTPCAPMVGDGARSLSRPSSTPSYARLSGIDASAVNLSSSSSLNFATRCSHITPGVVALFSSVDRDATLAFLRDYPTAESAGRVGVARMAGFCHRIGYSGRVPTDVLVGRLRAMLLTASPDSVNGHRFAALALADQLSLLNQQVRQFNRRIDELLAQHPDTPVFASFPAAGRITTAELLAEIGEDRDRFPNVQVLLAEAGAAPVTLASGKVHRVRIRYACNKRLRSTTTTWAYTLKRIDPVSRTRYFAAVERGATQHGALRSVAATWLRVVWRRWQDKTTYNPTRHRPT